MSVSRFRMCALASLMMLASPVASTLAVAEDVTGCPRAGTLGVSRTVEIDTTGGPGFGMEHYKAYDFLQPKEVVLTFDDGPQKFTTEAVLKALNDECVKATFFSIGKMALGYPDIIREVYRSGHTIGSHTWSHAAIKKLKTFDEGKDEIERGISGVRRAVGAPIAPFFRFPTLVDTPEAVEYLGKRNIAMFSTDIDSFDFKPQKVEHLVKTLMTKLDKKGKGILLMHDIHKTTAKAVPLLLAELKAKGYKVVHLTAKDAVTTLPEYDAAIEKDAKGLPQVGAERPQSSVIRTVTGTPPPGEAPAGSPGAVAPAQTGAAPAAATPASPASPVASEPQATNPAPGPATPAPAPRPQSALPVDASERSAVSNYEADVPADEAAGESGDEGVTSTGSIPSLVPGAVAAPVSSVIKTLGNHGREASAEPASAPSPAVVPNAPAVPKEPEKTVSQKAQELWEFWFGK